MKFLKDSFAYAHKAMSSLTDKNLDGAVKESLWRGQIEPTWTGDSLWFAHPFDHYGQMVEYLRMNGIVPPASRGQ